MHKVRQSVQKMRLAFRLRGRNSDHAPDADEAKSEESIPQPIPAPTTNRATTTSARDEQKTDLDNRVENAPENENNERTLTLLMHAVCAKSTDDVNALLTSLSKSEINSMIDGYTAIFFAAENGSLDAIRQIAQRGINLNVITDYNRENTNKDSSCDCPLVSRGQDGWEFCETAKYAKDHFKFDAKVIEHLKRYRHGPRTKCKWGDECVTFERVKENRPRAKERKIKDDGHFLCYSHPSEVELDGSDASAVAAIPTTSGKTPLIISLEKRHFQVSKWLIPHLSAEEIQTRNQQTMGWFGDGTVQVSDELSELLGLFGIRSSALTFERLKYVIEEDMPLAVENVFRQCTDHDIFVEEDAVDPLDASLLFFIVAHQLWHMARVVVPHLSPHDIEKKVDGQTVLEFADDVGIEVPDDVRELMEKFVASGPAAVFYAIENDMDVAVRRIMDRGVDITSFEQDGRTAIQAVLERADMRMFDLFVFQGIAVDEIIGVLQEKMQADLDLVQDLIVKKCVSLINKMVARNALSVEHPNSAGVTALETTISQENYDVMKIFVAANQSTWDVFAQGIQTKFRNQDSDLVFSVAYYGWIDLLPYLVNECGVDFDQTESNGYKAIQIACKMNRIGMVTSLIEEHKVNLNAYSETVPVSIDFVASARNNYDMLRLLIVSGANLKLCHRPFTHWLDEGTDETFIDTVMKKCDLECLKKLIKAHYRWDEDLKRFFKLDDEEDLNALVKNMNGNHTRNGLLHKATAYDFLEGVEYLMGKPLELDPKKDKNHRDQTCLHVAACQGAVRCARRLVYYCDPHAKDKSEKNVVEYRRDVLGTKFKKERDEDLTNAVNEEAEKDELMHILCREEKADIGELWQPPSQRVEVKPNKDRLKKLEEAFREMFLVHASPEGFHDRDELEELLEEKKAEIDEINEILGDLDVWFDGEGERCVSRPSYFRELRVFRQESPENFRFEGMGQVYKGAMKMHVMDKELYPVEGKDSWNDLVGDLKVLGDKLMKRQKDYVDTYLERNPDLLRQPVGWSLPRLFVAALFEQERLNFEMGRLADMTGGDLYVEAGVKSMFRTKEKKAYGKAEERHDFDIWDFSRAMISYNTLNEIIHAIRTLADRAKFPDLEIVNFYNRFTTVEMVDEAWKDVMLHVVLDGVAEPTQRLICEVQFSLWKMSLARKELGGHDVYENYRCAQELERYVGKELTKPERRSVHSPSS